MWLVELIFLLVFFVGGAALMPTAHSDSFARQRGIEDSNRQKRETIKRALADYKRDNPGWERIYTGSMVLLVTGFGLVMLFSVHASGSSLSAASTVAVAAGYLLQALALGAFINAAIAKRRYIKAALVEQGIGPPSG